MNERKLIELVKSHEELYNTSDSGYCNAQLRVAAWDDVAQQFGRTPQECVDAWRKLRNCYTNAKKRRKRKSNQNLGSWKYSDEMAFLNPYLKESSSFEDYDNMFVEDSSEKSQDSNTSTNISTTSNMSTAYERKVALIDLVRRYEHLYNPNCKEYTDLKERYVAWSEIADLHGSTVKYCKESWMRLRNSYSNAVYRRESDRSRKGTIGPWRFEKEMAFLRPYLQRRSSTENIGTLLKDEDSKAACDQQVRKQKSVELADCARNREASTEYSEAIEEDNTSTPDLMYVNHALDDVDHFFLSMSKMIKKLPKVEQFRIKLELHKTINEAVLKQDKMESVNDQTSVEIKLENSDPDLA